MRIIRDVGELADAIAFAASCTPNDFPKFDHDDSIALESELKRVQDAVHLARNKGGIEADFIALVRDVD
jgi:hypothetical protein